MLLMLWRSHAIYVANVKIKTDRRRVLPQTKKITKHKTIIKQTYRTSLKNKQTEINIYLKILTISYETVAKQMCSA